MNKLILPLTLIIGVALPLGACATDKPKAKLSSPRAAEVVAPKLDDAVKPPVSVSVGPQAPSSPIYFEFDSDQLTDDSQKTLQQMAEYLKANPGAQLTIEGHCDELGSGEYNLALGDRRARTARDYLEALGIAEERLKNISYGEEKPAVAGDNAKNRRGQFDLKVTQG